MRPDSVSTTQTTRRPVKAPETVAEFMRLLFRGLDEGHVAQRSGGGPR